VPFLDSLEWSTCRLRLQKAETLLRPAKPPKGRWVIRSYSRDCDRPLMEAPFDHAHALPLTPNGAGDLGDHVWGCVRADVANRSEV